MADPIRVDSKVSIIAIATVLVTAIGAHYGLQARVATLEASAQTIDMRINKEENGTTAVIGAINSVEKALIKVDGRLEKIEYRLGQLEKKEGATK